MFSANAESYVEPLPEYGAFEKTPLQRTVQLVKHDRDKHYANDTKHRPSSILLTTLTARAYEKALLQPASSLLEFVLRVVKGIPEGISKQFVSDKWSFNVSNPVNSQENFADVWTFEHYRRFNEWHKKALAWLGTAASSEGQGTDVLLNSLVEGFGEERVVKAAKALGRETNQRHESSQIKVSRLGRVGAVGAFAAPTTFFGE